MSKPDKVIPITSLDPRANPFLIHLFAGCTHHTIDLRKSRRNGPARIVPFPVRKPEKGLAHSPGASDPCDDRGAVEGENAFMPIFTLNKENHIRVFDPDQAKDTDETVTRFRSEQELEALAKQWPATRLVAIWNGIAGAVPVRKFASRQTATARIWQAIHNLIPAATEPKPKPQRQAAAVEQTEVAEPTKKDTVIALLSGGATIGQLVTATGWQKHSIRGFLSGTLKKKMGLKVLSTRNADGERVYKLRG
jgi:hypothetical protein